jgi:glutamyl-tRNA synthetase
VSVLEFQREGFLPEALCNYLLRLGWGHGDAEVLGRDEAIALFDLDGVGRAASRMDYAKLTHLNGVWLRQTDDARLTADVMRRLAEQPALAVDKTVEARVATLMPALKERAKTLVELTASAAFLARPLPFPLDAKADALMTPEARAMLTKLAARLEATDFSAIGVDAALRAFAEETGRKLGQVAQPLRAALTGSTMSPPIDATLAALGREESLARIAAVIG